jgi:kynurenine formamidase
MVPCGDWVWCRCREGLAADGVDEFAFIGASLKLRGADGAPMRPIALPID